MELHDIQGNEFMPPDSYILIFFKTIININMYPVSQVYSHVFGPVVEIYLFKNKMCLHQAVKTSTARGWQLIHSKRFRRVQFLVSCLLLWGRNQNTIRLEGIAFVVVVVGWGVLTFYFLLYSAAETLKYKGVYNLDPNHGEVKTNFGGF